MSRVRNFVFTQNNYESTDMVDSIDCKYMVYGKEVGESGTPHLQGFVSFSDCKTKTAVIKLMPGCHIDIAKTVDEAIAYCKKDGDFTERGTPPVSQKRKGEMGEEYWKNIRLAAQDGRFDDIPEPIRLRYKKNIECIHEDYQRKLPLPTLDKLDHEWHWGDSGSGKSRSVREKYPDAFIKMNNKWWDGYAREDVVIIEDFNLEQAKYLAHHLKIWSDHYPFPAEKKGGMILARPKKIIVTSNYSIETAFGDDVYGSVTPLLRRFKQIPYCN